MLHVVCMLNGGFTQHEQDVENIKNTLSIECVRVLIRTEYVPHRLGFCNVRSVCGKQPNQIRPRIQKSQLVTEVELGKGARGPLTF